VAVLETYVDGNHVYIGGKFNSVEGQPRTNFARFSRDIPDTTNPTVSGVAPADGATEVQLDANAAATFSEAMDPSTLTGSTFTLAGPDGTLVAATVGYDSATKRATLDPNEALDPMTAYTATLKGGSEGAKDEAGNALAADVSWSFTTTAACTITGSPAGETITGTTGDDVICAGAGNDIIKGLEGDDTIKGEGGTDTANFASSPASITASLADGSASGEGSDALVGVENITGSVYDDQLSGSEGNNNLIGTGGADTVVGLGGADKLTGGAGNDTLDSRDGVEGNDAVDGGFGTDACATDAAEASVLNCEQ
jgi:Ca2+-binding RTX toxin-like protein